MEDNLEPGRARLFTSTWLHCCRASSEPHPALQMYIRFQHHDFAADTLFRRSAVYRHCIIPSASILSIALPLPEWTAPEAGARRHGRFQARPYSQQVDVWAAVSMMIDCPNAVSTFTPRSTAKPSCSSQFVSSANAWYSFSPSSGWSKYHQTA